MRITAAFIGIWLEGNLPKAVSFDLPPQAALSDLMAEIGRRFGSDLPEKLWDKKSNAFKGPVLILKNNQDVGADIPALHEGDEIKFFYLPSGG